MPRQSNADKLIALGEKAMRQDKDHPEVWWVNSLHSEAVYRVQTYEDGWITCTCVHGLNNPGQATCYHVQAVEKKLSETRREEA